jgi:hypothetical protein
LKVLKNKIILVIFIFSFCSFLYADDGDYKWELINALTGSNTAEVERIISANINFAPPSEKRLIMSFVLTYSGWDTTLSALNLLQRNDVLPSNFDLYTAVNRNQSEEVINYLIQNGARANGEILLVAMEKRRYDIARQFIESGVDVNYQYPLNRNYSDGMTPLLHAVKQNNSEIARMLLERGANVGARAKDGSTALSLAQANGNSALYNLLIEYGASADGARNVNIPSQNSGGGIGGILGNQVNFQVGTYSLSGSSTSIRFSGNATSGSLSYVMNGTAGSGVYRVESGNLTIGMEGRTFIYRVDSNMSFSGNGETWLRVGN